VLVKVISLFTGAGGLDIGLERAGFEIAGCVESDRDCQQTLEANRPGWRLLKPGDIHQHRPADILSALELKRGEPTLLAGGPPCQPFSKSGQWKHGSPRRMQDPRAQTLRAYFDVLEATLPDFMLLENVKGITASRKQVTHKYEALDALRSALRRINRRHKTAYEPYALVIDTADHGVPQHRERVFVFAARDGAGLTEPDPTHGAVARAANGQSAVERYRNAWDAIWFLDDPDFDPELRPAGTWAELLPSIPEGANYLHHTRRGAGEPLFGWRTRYWSFLLKLAKARPSWTLQAQAGPATGPFHWRSRRLTSRELARLQCFPDDWELMGAPTSVRRQLGNAVPPPVGELLGLAIRRQICGERPRVRPSLIPEARDDCPQPETPAAVAQRYLALRGEHDDHPGAGLGPGARRRTAEPAPSR
jgi:DNA (cytosine-5)-methyltransferase 1